MPVPVKFAVAPLLTTVRPPPDIMPADQLSEAVRVTFALPASVPAENVRLGKVCAALKFTVAPLRFTGPVGRNCPAKVCVPPGKLIVPAPLIVPPAA